MGNFIRYYDSIPSDEIIKELESILVVDVTPPPPIRGASTGKVGFVGEFLKGSYDPVLITDGKMLSDDFGGYSSYIGESSSVYSHLDKAVMASEKLVDYEGNGYVQLYGLKFSQLVVCRVDTRVQPTTTTKTRMETLSILVEKDLSLVSPIRIPAGTRVSTVYPPVSDTPVFITSDDINIPAVNYSAVGASVTFTVGLTRLNGVPGSVIVNAIDFVLDPITGIVITSGVMEVGFTIGNLEFNDGSYSLVERYNESLNLLAANNATCRDIRVIWAARSDCFSDRKAPTGALWANIKLHVENCSNAGMPRIGILRPPNIFTMMELYRVGSTEFGAVTTPGATKTYVTTSTKKLAVNYEVTSVAQYRSDRLVFVYPQVSRTIKTGQESVYVYGRASDGTLSENYKPSVGADGLLASILSQSEPEENPGRQTSFTLNNDFEYKSPAFTYSDYKSFKAYGMCCPVYPEGGNLEFQSGITTLLTDGKRNIARRVFCDFYTLSLAQALLQYKKKLMRNSTKARMSSAVKKFNEDLLSTNFPDRQRIDEYSMSTSMNNATQMGKGIYFIATSCRMLASFENIVLLASVGEEVEIAEQ